MSGQLEFGEEDRSATLRRAWTLSLHLLASKVSPSMYHSFIESIRPLSFEENVVTLGVASGHRSKAEVAVFFQKHAQKHAKGRG